MGGSTRRWQVALWMALSVALLSPAAAQSAGGSGVWGGNRVLALPEAGFAPSGFTVEIVGENMHRFGDMPLHVTLSPTGPTFREDREMTFQLVFDPSSVVPSNRSTSYRFTVAVSAGSGPVRQTFYLPKWVLGGTLIASVLESGQPLRGYSGQVGPGNPGRGQREAWEIAWMESAQNNFCWIAEPGSVPLSRAGSAAEIADLRTLMVTLAPELLMLEPMSSPQASFSVLRQYGDAVGLRYRTVEEVPAHWQGIGQSHVWVTHWSTYRWLAENRPDAELALRQFVRCGGALWLLGADAEQAASYFKTAWDPDDFGVPEAEDDEEDLLRLSDDPHRVARLEFPDVSTLVQQNYSAASPLRARSALADQAFSQNRDGLRQNRFIDENRNWLRAHGGNTRRSDVVSLQLGLGAIVLCPEDGVPGSTSQWQAMIDHSHEHLSSVLTRGVDPIAGDVRYWNWVIPGVAQPPVYTFIGLLALFVILVGPVSYRKLNRMGRGYLMFFVAPILATVTTLFLFGYGLVSDGLGTQVRVRQVTWLCDRDGGAMRYWRSTYFAGMRPRDGLQFPAGTRLEPYYLGTFRSWLAMQSGEGVQIGNVTLDRERIRLSNGFLPSRQQRQFVAYRPLENAGSLSWDRGHPGTTARVRSGLDYPLREAVLRSADGQYWFADEIPAGATADLIPIDSNTVSRQFTDMYVRSRPEPPEGVSVGGGRNAPMDLVSLLASTDAWRNTTAGQRAGNGDGLLEWWLQHSLQTASSLRHGTFIALADVTEDCVAVPKAKVLHSIHYVLGDLH